MSKMPRHTEDATEPIRCQRLSKHYGDVQALQPLDLVVPAGAIFGFLGRNGAGKTTTIRLLTGLARPSSGLAWVNGVETTSADSVAREQFGYLPQDPAFYGWMNPRDYLDYVARLFQMDRQRRRHRVDEMLELVGLEQAARRRISGFSGGMVQRLGIAQALIHQPPVLFLDEPTSALDPAGRHEVLTLIERLQGQVTVFLSSHILADVERVCDTIGIIHEGVLLLVADRDELLSRYASNAIALQVERNSFALLDGFLSHLQKMPWVISISRKDNVIRITVDDSDVARSALLPLVIEHGLILDRYEWVRPSLEEIFLTISG
jgi:ABC-2 type transport system ATP-binding protein